ncbi:hypothetical protein, partial [Streptomyces rochei]
VYGLAYWVSKASTRLRNSAVTLCRGPRLGSGHGSCSTFRHSEATLEPDEVLGGNEGVLEAPGDDSGFASGQVSRTRDRSKGSVQPFWPAAR